VASSLAAKKEAAGSSSWPAAPSRGAVGLVRDAEETRDGEILTPRKPAPRPGDM
jgi:hypothetical protein